MKVPLTLGMCTALLIGSAAAAMLERIELPRAEEVKAFAAAGFDSNSSECELEETGTYTGVSMQLKDLNGDGQPDGVITEGSTSCYGQAGQGFFIVSRQADGHWTLIARGEGEPVFLETRGVNGWPDFEVAGPGTRVPVLRYDGEAYRLRVDP